MSLRVIYLLFGDVMLPPLFNFSILIPSSYNYHYPLHKFQHHRSLSLKVRSLFLSTDQCLALITLIYVLVCDTMQYCDVHVHDRVASLAHYVPHSLCVKV